MDLVGKVEKELERKRAPFKVTSEIREKVDKIVSDVERVDALLKEKESCVLKDSAGKMAVSILKGRVLFHRWVYSIISLVDLREALLGGGGFEIEGVIEIYEIFVDEGVSFEVFVS